MVQLFAPVSGKVQETNAVLVGDPAVLCTSPYKDGWVCRIAPRDLAVELGNLRIGRPVVAWYGEELNRMQTQRSAQSDPAKPLAWSELEQGYFAKEPVQAV